MRNDLTQSVRIAFTYIGTVVGAGFASGREIVEFFVRYGIHGLIGIWVAALLFVWAGVRVMVVTRRIQAHSYQEFNTHLLGRTAAPVFNAFLAIMLLGTTSVMLAAIGSLFAETFSLPAQAGIWISMAGILAVTIRGLDAIHSMNSMFVPILIGFTLLAFLNVQPWEADWTGIVTQDDHSWSWLRAAVSYAALNVALTQAVLVPIGRESTNDRPLVWGGILGGAGISFLLFLAYSAMIVNMPQISYVDMPMIYLLSGWGKSVTLAYALLVYVEVFSTLVANVFGLVQHLKKRTPFPPALLICGILAFSYAVSFVGFSSLLSLLYPLFGKIVALFLIMLFYRQFILREKPHGRGRPV